MDSDHPHRNDSNRRQHRQARNDHVEATAFLHEIVTTADALREARAFDGEPAMHYETRSRVLRAIERCGGAPTFTDLGRLLGMSRQAARGHALEAAKRGVVELFQAPDDQRAWQVALTPTGCRELERQRKPQLAWILTLLSGLEPEPMRTTRHVLSVIRQRLERYEKELREAQRALNQRGIGSPFNSETSPRTWR
jgi:DNA-binding MarR family transcriptional regulator